MTQTALGIADGRALGGSVRVIVTDRSNFPTDLYIASGVADLLGCEVRAVERAVAS